MLYVCLIAAVFIVALLAWEPDSLEDCIRQAIAMAPNWPDDDNWGPLS